MSLSLPSTDAPMTGKRGEASDAYRGFFQQLVNALILLDPSASTPGNIVVISSGTSVASSGAPVSALPRTVVKSSNESVTSSTTLQDDDDLFVSLAAVGVYLIEIQLLVTGAQAGDIKIGFTGPASATGIVNLQGQTIAATTVDTSSRNLSLVDFATPDTASFGCVSTTLPNGVFGSGAIFTGASTGTLRLQWAQNASSGTATVVNKGSWIRATKTG